jgi:hypothetical protein
MLVSFLAAPSTNDPATHPCLQDLVPVQYTIPAATSSALLGTPDPFNGDVSPVEPGPKPGPKPPGPKPVTEKWVVPLIASAIVAIGVGVWVIALATRGAPASNDNEMPFLGMMM